ncbi:MAG: hypothetical protein NTX36_10230 [Proteobacteria bacterium]|nr:hypothetical protein [Pseudomonadota bacterium]
MKILPLYAAVTVNTGGNSSHGLLVDDKFSHQDKYGNRIYRKVPFGHYWKDRQCYLVRFDNGTQQYIPTENIIEI